MYKKGVLSNLLVIKLVTDKPVFQKLPRDVALLVLYPQLAPRMLLSVLRDPVKMYSVSFRGNQRPSPNNPYLLAISSCSANQTNFSSKSVMSTLSGT